MPVTQCSNGKWKIGSGDCIYDTREKAVEVWQAILASGQYGKSKQYGKNSKLVEGDIRQKEGREIPKETK